MKEQLDRYRTTDEHNSTTDVKQLEHRQRVLIEILNNCLVYVLPYVSLVDAEKEFKQHSELHRLFEGIRFKLEHIESLKDTAEQLSKDNTESE